MRLILFGLGQGLNLVEKKIKKEHEIIGYMDSFSSLSIFRGKPFYKLDEVREIDFDFVIISIQDKETALMIYEMLIKEYKLDKNKVIPFYVYANYELHNFKMRSYDIENIQGLIFGNSHAECGFLEEELSIPFLNLSVSAQDIYYSYKTFQKCVSKYGEQLKKLRCVIIDLYDYCYFNLDASMARYAINYICWGGFLEEHNFHKNHNFHKSFYGELRDMGYIPQRPSSMYLLFDDISAKRNDLQVSSRWSHIKKENCLTAGPIIGGIVSNRKDTTIKENINLLNMFLEEIQQFNSNIKIIFTLIPRYIEMERATERVMTSWKEEFNSIVNSFCKKYGALFWNYKIRKEISENHMFYYDVEHMNTVGGRALTAILDEDLKKIL